MKSIKRIDLYDASHKADVILYIAHNITSSILLFICLVLAIVCVIRQFKLLERVTVDNLRFLNPLGHDYVGGAYYISPELYDEDKPYIYFFKGKL